MSPQLPLIIAIVFFVLFGVCMLIIHWLRTYDID